MGGFWRSNQPIRARIEEMSEWEPNTGCLLWFGAVRAGYPKIRLFEKTMSAHRLSLLDSLGLESSPLQALHSCDTPMCVNPDHLYLGTHIQNMADKCQRNRSPKTYVKPTPDDKKSIAAMFASGSSKRAIARETGFSTKTVKLILDRES